MGQKFLLTIAIPTKNQPKDLERTLKSIIFQINSTNQEVEIVIGDNSTNEETKKLIEEKFRLPFLRYFNNNGDIGIDKNILNLIEKSRGKYIWLMGDDEIDKGGIDYVLNIIKNNNIPLIWVNFRNFDPQNPHLSFRSYSTDRYIIKGEDVIKELGVYLNFISTIILKKEELLKIIFFETNKIEKYIGSGLINLFLPLKILAKHQNFLLISYPFVIAYFTPRDLMKYDYFNVLGVNFEKLLKEFKYDFSYKIIKNLRKEMFGYMWRDFLLQRLKNNNYSFKKIFLFIKLYKDLLNFWFIFPFMLMPNILIKFFYFLYKKILKIPTYTSVRILIF